MAKKKLTFNFLGTKATEEEIVKDGHLLVKTEYGYMYPLDKLPQRTKNQVEKGLIEGCFSRNFHTG